jgi:hypothetical protein
MASGLSGHRQLVPVSVGWPCPSPVPAVLSRPQDETTTLVLLPTGPGESRSLPNQGIETVIQPSEAPSRAKIVLPPALTRAAATCAGSVRRPDDSPSAEAYHAHFLFDPERFLGRHGRPRPEDCTTSPSCSARASVPITPVRHLLELSWRRTRSGRAGRSAPAQARRSRRARPLIARVLGSTSRASRCCGERRCDFRPRPASRWRAETS